MQANTILQGWHSQITCKVWANKNKRKKDTSQHDFTRMAKPNHLQVARCGQMKITKKNTSRHDFARMA